MKKSLFLFAILTIFAINTLHSQWLEKEGYWELSEKIPDLRDLKIIPEENLIITVSKDNTIRHIEYDSGKILKSGKPTGITEDNDYAKISSDGKTTVVARYVKNEKSNTFNSIEFSVIKNSDLSNLQLFIIDPTDLYIELYWKRMKSIKLEDTDYNLINGYFFFNIYTSSSYIESSTQYNRSRNDIYSGIIQNNKFVNLNSNLTILEKDKFKVIENKKNFNIPRVDRFYSSSEYLNGNKAGGHSEGFTIDLFNKNFDSSAKIMDYTYSYSWVYDSDPTSSGYRFELQQILNDKFEGNLYLRGHNKLFNFDINSCEFVDSVDNRIFQGNVQISNNNRFIHSVHRRDYTSPNLYHINLLPKMEYIYTFPIELILNPVKPIPIVNDINKSTLFVLENGSIYKLLPHVMKDIPESGFIWSKDTVEIGEELEFTALVNIEGCKFNWNFNNEETVDTKEAITKYKFKSIGQKDVKLKITAPDNTTYEFQKDSIINVWEVLKADFEIETLNNELPLKVQFTDISKGTIISWKWDFGDGKTSTVQNPVHEYQFPGDFSPKLIVSNLLNKDTITKNEAVLYLTDKIESQLPLINYVENTSSKNFRFIFLTQNGFSIGHNYIEVKYDELIYNSNLIVQIKNYDFNLNKFKTYNLSLGTKSGSKLEYVNSIFSVETLLSNKNTLVTLGRYSFGAGFSDNYISYINIEKGNIIKYYNNVPISNFYISKKLYDYSDSSIVWSRAENNLAYISKSDYKLNYLWNTKLTDKKCVGLYSDTLYGKFYIINNIAENNFEFYIVNYDGKIEMTRTLSIQLNITLTGIKVVNENLILLNGFYTDRLNKTTYAYYCKYHPLDNTLEPTLLYSRKDIRKIERVNNSTFAAIGQSRERQGYLLLDTNLHQIKDIRVDSLTGEIKDMILHDNKVYLFTEKIVKVNNTNSYQTTASVLSLPDDIIANVEDSPKIISDKLTHTAYPNPASDVINLKVSSVSNDKCSIKLYDLLGVEILTIYDGIIPAGTERNFSIQSNNLAQGAYYYVIRNGSSFGSGQINVMR